MIDALGRSVDGKGPLSHGAKSYRVRGAPPPAHARARVGEKIDLGVRSLNAFATACQGQRLGIFRNNFV